MTTAQTKFSWVKAYEEGATADSLPPGTHRLTVNKIVTGSRSGGLFKTKTGDPQIMVVFADSAGREASHMYTLSDKAAWTLAILLARIGEVTLGQLDQEGVLPQHFSNKDIAENYLLGRSVWASVAYEEVNGKMYSRVEPIKNEDASVTNSHPDDQQHKPIPEDDIPF